MKHIITSIACIACASTLIPAATLVVSPDLTIDTTGSDPGSVTDPTIASVIETDFPELIGDMFTHRNDDDPLVVDDRTFTVNGASTLTAVTGFTVYGLLSDLTLTNAVALDGVTPVTFSLASSPAPSDLSITGVSGSVGDVILGSDTTSGSTRFTGVSGNDSHGIARIIFNTPVTSFTLQDVTGNRRTDTFFVAFSESLAVPEPSSFVLFGLSTAALCLRRKR